MLFWQVDASFFWLELGPFPRPLPIPLQQGIRKKNKIFLCGAFPFSLRGARNGEPEQDCNLPGNRL